MYIAHLDFTDWLCSVETEGLERIYIQNVATTGTVAGAVPTMTSALVLSAAGEDGPIVFARIVVERAELWQREKELREAIIARSDEALQTTVRAILSRLPWATIRRGILLRQGMLDDLTKITTDHELWRWEKPEKGDPVEKVLGRRLVA